MEFEQIYKRYFTDVYYYMCSICNDRSICEEVAQESFFRALKKIDSFDGKSDIRAWLFTIAKNTYLSILRKDKRRLNIDDKALESIASEIRLDDRLAEKDDAFRIHAILHTLNEPYKEVFSLRVFGELDYESIGKLFHRSAGWARVTYYRAKMMILNRLEEQDEL